MKVYLLLLLLLYPGTCTKLVGKSGSTTECWAYLKSTVLLLWHPWSCIPAFKYHPHTKSTYLYLTQRFRHFPPPMYPKHHFAPEPKTTPATVPGKHCLKSCKTVCNHLSKIDRLSTRIKTKFLRVGCVGGVGKGLYYHRFVDVLSMGNGMKWDDLVCFRLYSFILMKKWKKDLNLDLCF